MEEKTYLTMEKKAELEAELSNLKGNERSKIIEALEYAKSLGDLSENAEYHQARDDQAKLEDRINQIENILKHSVIVSKHVSTVVEVGSTVEVEKQGGDKKTFEIVGSEESDMTLGKISNRSPIGSALLGKKKGDTAEVNTPAGIVVYKIINLK